MPVYFDNTTVTRNNTLNRTHFTITNHLYVTDEFVGHAPESAVKELIEKYGIDGDAALDAIRTLKRPKPFLKLSS